MQSLAQTTALQDAIEEHVRKTSLTVGPKTDAARDGGEQLAPKAISTQMGGGGCHPSVTRHLQAQQESASR